MPRKLLTDENCKQLFRRRVRLQMAWAGDTGVRSAAYYMPEGVARQLTLDIQGAKPSTVPQPLAGGVKSGALP